MEGSFDHYTLRSTFEKIPSNSVVQIKNFQQYLNPNSDDSRTINQSDIRYLTDNKRDLILVVFTDNFESNIFINLVSGFKERVEIF